MKILFASMPFDGHFNPLTGVAGHFRASGHEVRWYTGASYGARLAALGVKHEPFRSAVEVNAQNLAEHFPEYAALGTGPKAIEFALSKIFFGNVDAHFQDLKALHAEFPFEAFISDAAFYASYLVTRTLQPHAFVVYPAPTPAPTGQTPPPFFGLRPPRSVLHRLGHAVVRRLVERSTRPGMAAFNALLAREGLPRYAGSVFDLHVHGPKAVFQSGAPEFEFPRTDWPANFQFVGPLLPAKRARGELLHEARLAAAASVVVVSQGTVDNRDPEKLIVPTLEALKGGPHLVVATTGGRNTQALRQRFPQPNVIIEDYLDFEGLLAHADLFVCNGGYGSIMLSLMRGVPVLSAGTLEGKNDINARVEHSGVGLDLKTERPTAAQVARGVERVLGDHRYLEAVERMRSALEAYRPNELIERAVLHVGATGAQ